MCPCVRTNLKFDDVQPQLTILIEALFQQIPTGVGRTGKYHFTTSEIHQLLEHGPQWLVSRGLAVPRDIDFTEAHGRHIDQELESRGIIARARSWRGLAEEQPAAYKDVDLVVEVVHKAGLASKVARLRPIGVIKG
jgi:RNA-splicing ligase RtcB